MHINKETQGFLDELKQNPDIFGVILFGSWARGNNRPDSDVDLIIIQKEGFRRTIEYRNQQAFEIIYTTEQAAYEYWQENKDDAFGLWEVAQILFERDGVISGLQRKAEAIFAGGKSKISETNLRQMRFDAEDLIRCVESVLPTDPVLANFLLTNKMYMLTEWFFDIRQLWTPAPKQRLAKIAELSPAFFVSLAKYLQEGTSLEEKLEIIRKTVPLVFE